MSSTDRRGASARPIDGRDPARRSGEVFVGRDAELAAAVSCAADVERGRPWVVLVEAPGGAGKSAFLRRVVASLAGFVLIEAAADELATGEPMWLLGQLVAPNVATSPFAAAMELLGVLAERQAEGPVALVVEDLHWADGPSRRALLTALQRLQGDRVLVIVTTRPDGRSDDEAWAKLVDDPARCLRVDLGALSSAEVRELANRLDVPLGPNAAVRLHRHTEGHALWVRTLLRELTPGELSAFGALPAPRSLAATTVERVAALPEASLELVRAMAVLGRPTSLLVLGRVAGVADPTAALDGALSTQFIEWAPSGSAQEVRFAHPLFAAAVYGDIPPLRRRQLHRAAATEDAGLALTHRLAAADRADEALAVELEVAAAGSQDPSTAARWLVAAADVSEQPPDATRRLLAAGRGHLAAGDVHGLLQLQTRLDACPPSAERDLLLGWVEWQRGDLERAERLLRAAAADADSRGAAAALAQLGSLYAFQSRGEESIAAGRAALALGSLDAHDEEVAWRVVCSGVNQARGGVAAVAALNDHYLSSNVDPDVLDQSVQRTYAVCENCAGRPAAAVVWFERMMAQPPRGAEVAHLAHSHMIRAQCHYRLGAWDDALLHAHTAIDLAADEAQAWVLGHVNAVAAWIHGGRGQWDLAERHLEHARAAAAAVPIAGAVILTRVADAFIARARGDAGTVAELLSPLTGDGRLATPASSNLGYWPPLIHALVDVGRTDEAASELERMCDAAEARDIDLRMQELTIHARLRSTSGDAAAATAAFGAAVDAVHDEADFLDQIVLRHSFGRHLRAVGRRREALVQLAAAHTLAESAGASPYLERIDADLRSSETGAPSARADPLGTLTARERDVVTLIAAGSTNREAAASLYVSVKAVEYHLGNVYAKLHIRSRRELKALVAMP